MARHYMTLGTVSFGIAGGLFAAGYVIDKTMLMSSMMHLNDFVEYSANALKIGGPILGLVYFASNFPRTRDLERQLYLDNLSANAEAAELEEELLIAQDRRDRTQRRIDRNRRRRRP